jgi:ABC-type branched-subunit amino acid transport system ATPase component
MLGRDLSVSWRKRLELARALASGPKVLLLDEVLAGLNELEINEMVRLLPTLTTNMTVLIIEHVIQAVLQLCRRAVFMQAGAVLVDGAPNAVMNDPVVIDSYLGTEREC